MQIIINHKNSPNVIIIIIERQILGSQCNFFPDILDFFES